MNFKKLITFESAFSKNVFMINFGALSPMPYYQRSWNVVYGQSSAPVSGVKLRKLPATDRNQTAPTPPKPKEVELDQSRVTFTRTMLATAVQDLTAATAAKPCKDDPAFLQYTIQRDNLVYEGKHSNIYGCYNHQHGDHVLVARVYQGSALIVADTDLYLRVLRVLGRAHPCIIATFDLYSDEAGQVYVFQEYAAQGNAYNYVKAGNAVCEKQLCAWSQSVYRAMDYLGDVAIVHRNISPKHILLKQLDSGDLIAKLSSFRDAAVYWNPALNDVIDQPCKPLVKRIFLGFQAPEVFGADDEFYNPVVADVWSLGATLFFIGARVYPYNMMAPEPDLDAEIHRTVTAAVKLSDEAKSWMYGLLRVNTELRTEFEAIQHEPWFTSY